VLSSALEVSPHEVSSALCSRSLLTRPAQLCAGRVVSSRRFISSHLIEEIQASSIRRAASGEEVQERRFIRGASVDGAQ